MGVLACEILELSMVLVPTGAHLDSDLTCLPTIVEHGEGSARMRLLPPDRRKATPMQMLNVGCCWLTQDLHVQ
jgi:hypothetical protein